MKALEKGIPDAAYKPLTGDDRPTAKDFERRNKSDKGQQTRVLDFSGKAAQPLALPLLAESFRAVRSLPEDTLEQIAAKRDRLARSHGDPRLANLHQAADLYIAAFLIPKTKSQSLDLHTALVPTTEDVWTAMRSGTVYGRRLGEARKLAANARAFHWSLEFPDVMASGGFDVIIGNPPWEVMQLGEEEYFAQHWPEVAELAGVARKRAIAALQESHPAIFAAYESEKRKLEASNEFARASERFDLTARGKVNTYGLFAELFTALPSRQGHTGVIVPTGIATDATTAPFFASLIENRRLAELIDFENREKLFPDVDSRMKFSLLTTSRDVPAANFAFFLTDVAQLAEPERRFSLSPEEIAAINPNTNTAPVFRSRKDAELTAKIYARVPVLINEKLGEEGNPWGIGFRQGLFNMTSDSGLFRAADQLQEAGYQREGSDWILPVHQPALLDAAQPGHLGLYDGAAAPPERYVPLFEAKMIHQFDHRWATYDGLESRDSTEAEKQNPGFEATPRYWVPANEVRERLANKGWERDWLMGWRDITNATNERTVISAAFPAMGSGDTLLLMFPSPQHVELNACLIGNLISLALDYTTRQKIGGTHLKYNIFKQIAVLLPSAYPTPDIEFIVHRVLELTYTSHSMSGFARDLGYDGPPFAWDEDRRALFRAELDAWYARAYGLTRDELRYILDPADVMGPDYPSETFRVLKNNEIRKYRVYRTQRLVLDAWDRMERGELHCPAPYRRPERVAVAEVNPLLGAGPLFEVPGAAPITPPIYVPLSTIPDSAWAMPAYNSVSVELQLAAILKKLPGPTPADKVRLAALYALRPDYLTLQLAGEDRNAWQRLVGNNSRVTNAMNVIKFVPGVSIEWRDAYTQLRGMHALLEDSDNNSWAPGSAIQDFLTEGWPDGRAGFVLKMLEGMEIERSISALPTHVQAWVTGYAA